MGMTGRLLFALGLLLAGLLVALVVAAPLIEPGEEMPDGLRRVVSLFGHDAGLRRTSLASAAGLVVTACVFFRRRSLVSPTRRATVTRPRTPGAAGA